MLCACVRVTVEYRRPGNTVLGAAPKILAEKTSYDSNAESSVNVRARHVRNGRTLSLTVTQRHVSRHASAYSDATPDGRRARAPPRPPPGGAARVNRTERGALVSGAVTLGV